MKILYLTDGLFPDHIGGIQKYGTEFLAHYPASEGNIDVLCQHASPAAQKHLQQNRAISFLDIQIPNSSFPSLPGKYIADIFAFSKGVKKYILNHPEYDLIYCQGFLGLALGKSVSGIPVVQNLHGLEMFQPVIGFKSKFTAWLFRMVVKRILKRSDHVISLGARLNDIIRKINPQTVVYTIPNAVASTWILEPKSSEAATVMRFLFVGRYEWRKGIETLNQTLLMLDSHPDFRAEMLFVGDIPAEHQVRLSWVTYAGAVRDENKLKEFFDGCDVLISASYSEGMPTVILEAMARGLAIIATDVGATAELVSPSNGLLIQPFDAEMMKNAMLKMCNFTAAERADMAIVSQKQIRTVYNWENIVKQHAEVFKLIAIK